MILCEALLTQFYTLIEIIKYSNVIKVIFTFDQTYQITCSYFQVDLKDVLEQRNNFTNATKQDHLFVVSDKIHNHTVFIYFLKK